MFFPTRSKVRQGSCHHPEGDEAQVTLTPRDTSRFPKEEDFSPRTLS